MIQKIKKKLILHIKEGERVIIKDYLFKTDKRTEYGALRRIARVKKDQYFSLHNLRQTKKSILKTNAFSGIAEKILKQGDNYYLYFEIQEKSADYIVAGGAFAQAEYNLMFEFYSLNIFGTLRQFHFNYKSNFFKGLNKKFLSLNFTEPVFLHPVKFNTAFQIWASDSARLTELNASFNSSLNDYLEFNISSGIEMTGYLTDTGRYNHSWTVLGTGLRADFSTENYIFSNETKLDYLIRDNERIRIFYDGNAGYANFFVRPHYRFVGTENFEYFDYIQLGGSKNLRGYMEDEFRIKRGFWINIEYRKFPVYPLLDVAYLDDDYTYSYGVGIDARTNLANASLIFAMPEKGKWNDAKVHIILEKKL